MLKNLLNPDDVPDCAEETESVAGSVAPSLAESVSMEGGCFSNAHLDDDLASIGTMDTHISVSSTLTDKSFKIKNKDRRREQFIKLRTEQK